MNNKQPCTYEVSFLKYADSITSKNNLKYLLHHIKQFNVNSKQICTQKFYTGRFTQHAREHHSPFLNNTFIHFMIFII